MRIPRLYQPCPLHSGERLELTEDAVNYLKNVLRLGEGHWLKIFNGDGRYLDAEIVEVGKRTLTVQLGTAYQTDNESRLQLGLAQCISRGERMDYTLQKAVELGITEIQPLFSARTQVKLDGERLLRKQQHWQQIVISACEQSGRNRVPVVAPPLPLHDWLQQSTGQRLLLSPTADQSLASLPLQPANPVWLLIGPEGGLSEPEIELARSQGCLDARLGPRVLRTETAALVALSVLQAQWGDLNG